MKGYEFFEKYRITSRNIVTALETSKSNQQNTRRGSLVNNRLAPPLSNIA